MLGFRVIWVFGFRVLGIRVKGYLGIWVLGLRVLGFRVLGIRVVGCWVLGFRLQGFGLAFNISLRCACLSILPGIHIATKKILATITTTTIARTAATMLAK